MPLLFIFGAHVVQETIHLKHLNIWRLSSKVSEFINFLLENMEKWRKQENENEIIKNYWMSGDSRLMIMMVLKIHATDLTWNMHVLIGRDEQFECVVNV